MREFLHSAIFGCRTPSQNEVVQMTTILIQEAKGSEARVLSLFANSWAVCWNVQFALRMGTFHLRGKQRKQKSFAMSSWPKRENKATSAVAMKDTIINFDEKGAGQKITSEQHERN